MYAHADNRSASAVQWVQLQSVVQVLISMMNNIDELFFHCFSRLVSHRVKRTLRVQETRNVWNAIRRAARKAGVQRAFDP